MIRLWWWLLLWWIQVQFPTKIHFVIQAHLVVTVDVIDQQHTTLHEFGYVIFILLLLILLLIILMLQFFRLRPLFLHKLLLLPLYLFFAIPGMLIMVLSDPLLDIKVVDVHFLEHPIEPLRHQLLLVAQPQCGQGSLWVHIIVYLFVEETKLCGILLIILNLIVIVVWWVIGIIIEIIWCVKAIFSKRRGVNIQIVVVAVKVKAQHGGRVVKRITADSLALKNVIRVVLLILRIQSGILLQLQNFGMEIFGVGAIKETHYLQLIKLLFDRFPIGGG